ncbi:MAG: SurA N-terminal domain-containing protein [bacterium]|nr:SurA N-terminal domain-containing protein [bacterium]
MLKSIRKNMKPIMWITALSFLATIFFAWGMGVTSKARTNITVAKVNGVAIKYEEFRYALTATERNYRRMYGDQFDRIKKNMDMDNQVLNQLIDQKLLMQEIKKQRIKISDKEIIDRIKQDPVFKNKKGGFDKAKFEQYVNGIPASQWQEIENGIKKSLALEHLWKRITDPVIISDKKILDEFMLKNEKVKINYICFRVDEFKTQVSVNDEDIAEYFSKNKTEFKQPDRVNTEYVLIKPEPFKEKTEVSDDEIRKYYAENKQEFEVVDKKPKEIKLLEEVRAQIKEKLTKEKAEQLAQERAYDLSIDLGEENKWEEILKKENLLSKQTGYFAEGEEILEIGYSREFSQSAFSLGKDDISDPIKTAKGFCILRLVDLKPSYIPEQIEEVKEDVRKRLTALKSKELAEKKADEFIEKSQSAKNIEKLAKKFGYEVKQTDFFERGVYTKDIGYAPKLIAEAFLLKKGDVKKASESQDVFVIELVERKAADKGEFNTQKEQIKQTLLQKKKQSVYEKWFKNLKQEAKIVNNLDEIRRAQ